ncbi:MAG: hypothetical protein P8P46_08220, partial [Alphaproteobacteria bacterium]|nr:hypothetical protein [Alphaproteobacteria bacterium]
DKTDNAVDYSKTDNMGSIISQISADNPTIESSIASSQSSQSSMLTAEVPQNFIPSAPVLTEKSVSIDTRATPDPFNAAAIVNTGLSGTAKKGRNLFQRVTGIGKKDNESEKTDLNIQNDFLRASLPIVPKVDLGADPLSQSDMSSGSSITSRKNENIDSSLLDIPAFLRRPSS